MGRSDILAVLRVYKETMGERYGITALGIFGSFARDTATDDSDVDVCVCMPDPDPFKLVHLKEHLEQSLKRHVDIVRIRDVMNPVLKQRIERDAIYV
jgi:predicted nucleotidyltransferase